MPHAMHVDPPTRAARPRVTHAVFPVAGFGTTFLPATKACPKELLPIVDRPLIQYAVEEAAAAGLTHLILVTGRHKRAIEDHFDRAYELEHELAARASEDALRDLRSAIPPGVTFSFVRQRDVSGLTDALRRARPFVRDQPFAVILPDELIDAKRPAIAQLLEVFDEQGTSVVGALRAHDAGCDAPFMAADLAPSALRAARTLVKVPPIGASSVPVGSCGRYVFSPAVWRELARGDDPFLARTVRALMDRERVFACLVDGTRYDCGSKLGFLEAQFAFARKRNELWSNLSIRIGHLLDDEAEASKPVASGSQSTDMKAAIMR